jgi:hypothetical protein
MCCYGFLGRYFMEYLSQRRMLETGDLDGSETRFCPITPSHKTTFFEIVLNKTANVMYV